MFGIGYITHDGKSHYEWASTKEKVLILAENSYELSLAKKMLHVDKEEYLETFVSYFVSYSLEELNQLF